MQIVTVKWKRNLGTVSVTVSPLQKFTLCSAVILRLRTAAEVLLVLTAAMTDRRWYKPSHFAEYWVAHLLTDLAQVN
jgi:hypothetical protein